jgi:diguanylate cyclase (GGDEF)-like protein
MSGAHVNWRHRLLIAALAWLLILFVVGVWASTRGSTDEVSVRLQPGSGTLLSRDGVALVLSDDPSRDATAVLQFELPPPDPQSSRWVIWIGRDPLDTVWLERGDWRSPERHFFRPSADEGALPGGFLLPLPADWQGSISLVLHARSGTTVSLRPRVMHEAAATQVLRRGVALESAIYAGLFVLGLLSLALYSAARERSFVALFACAASALLLLSAQNGHLYQVPGFALLSTWRVGGLWVLSLGFTACALQVLLRYAGLRGGVDARRWVDRYCLILFAIAAMCLLNLPALDSWLPPMVTLALFGGAAIALAMLVEALRRHVPMATAMLLLVLLTLSATLVRSALAHGWVMDVSSTRFGYQFVLVVTIALLSVGLLSRIGEFRDQRDRDHLARMDSERRMSRESARADLTLALQTRLRGVDPADIEWIAFRLLLERLSPEIPVEWAAVVAYGYHGHDVLVVEPVVRKQQVHDLIAARNLALKRLAMHGMPVQQSGSNGHGACIEALLPLAIRAPGWGMLMLQRTGSEGFTTEEIGLAGEFARLAVLQADESVASAQLRQSAELDALTGTFNRRTIDQWLARAFLDAHRQHRPLSLLFIDIDHFKSVNDRLGHAGGDHCLREVATALRGALEVGDTLGRYGGEEFVVLLPGRGGSEAREMAERLRAAVERREFRFEGHGERLTVSIGVATRLDRESTPAEAVKRADNALYTAKRAGRNCVHVAPAVFS